MSPSSDLKSPRKMKPTVSLAMIARDRARQLERALESVARYVDEIVVVDAGGSTDDTVDVAKSFGARVIPFLPQDHPEAFFDDVEDRFSKHGLTGDFTGRKVLADFSAPRNISFDACTSDYIFWIDSDDEVIRPDRLREVLEAMEQDRFQVMLLDYDYAHDDQGNVVVKQKRERIIKRGAAKWFLPIHEHLNGPGLSEKVAYCDSVLIRHRHEHVRQGSSLQGKVRVSYEQRDEIAFRNLKCLLVQQERAEAEGVDLLPDLYFYLGNEWRSLDVERAISYYERYLPHTQVRGQLSQTRYYIGQLREAQKQWELAWNYMAGAVMDSPDNAGAWFSLARIAVVRGDWQEVIRFSEEGLKAISKVNLSPNLVQNPQEAKYMALLPYTAALVEVGRYEEALKFCNEGLNLSPGCVFLSKHKLDCLEKIGGLA